MEELDNTWDEIIYWGIATKEELELVTYINGYNMETLNDIIEVRTGYKTLEQYKEYEVEE